ncbi:MAG: class II aldolase/adducin family protein [Ardenticatenaceae bacterium]|nr:class II aldolase/adducin family protein [Ardenticatenaceae bacterium]
MLEEIRQIVCGSHAELPKNNLVTWSSGNISSHDPETNLVVIKPSGIQFPDLTPESMVMVDINGRIVENSYKYPPLETSNKGRSK